MDGGSYKNILKGSFNPSPHFDKCNREEHFDKHIYLSILRIFKQMSHWSVLTTVVFLRLELYLVWWTDSNADQVPLSGFNLNLVFLPKL